VELEPVGWEVTLRFETTNGLVVLLKRRNRRE
jgi:hypothetical protein